jgi:hypothetical protein
MAHKRKKKFLLTTFRGDIVSRHSLFVSAHYKGWLKLKRGYTKRLFVRNDETGKREEILLDGKV